ncbi:MAG: fibronectin type III domain-containing protein, partial [Nitrospinae bacterium]|nr:fibronectin type III domain-containing protein [Nitrospinota bacterium]
MNAAARVGTDDQAAGADRFHPDKGVRVLSGAKRTGAGAFAARLRRLLAGMLLAAGFGLLAAAPVHAQSEGDLRLQGGASLSHQEGRLEIYHGGEWGTVCDDYFTLQEAAVACKQMGFTGAQELVRGWWWTSSKPIWLDDVDCDGTETSLSQCSNRGWGVHNCDHSEDVRMRCTEATTAAGVLIGKRKLRIDEQDTTGAKYSVKLGKVPSGNVTVTVGGHSGTDLTVNPATLNFTTSNWDDAQDVTVTAGNDSDTTQDTATLTHSATGGGYGSVTIPSVAVEVNDNDDKGVTISPQSMTIYEAVTPELSYFQKPNDTYSVVLTGQPSANVTVTIAGHSGTDISLSDSGGTTISSLTFTTSNWSTPQTVKVTAAYDVDQVDEALVTLTHTPSGGGYNNVSIPDVTVQVDDIYYRGVAVNQVPLLVGEGESVGDEFIVVLNGPPTGNVTITFAPPNGENLSFDPAQLVFTKNDWRPAKRVHVRQENDADDQHERVEIGLSAAGGGYGSVTIPPIEVTLIDDDNGGLPGRPRNIRATPRPGGVGLNWDPPLEDPEKPVQNYEYQQDGETGWTPTGGPGTSKEVTGLTNGESYKFRMRAVNAEGKGAASEPSAPVTPAPAGLTASFESVPASHDGSGAFTLELAFSEAVFDGSESFNKNRAI